MNDLRVAGVFIVLVLVGVILKESVSGGGLFTPATAAVLIFVFALLLSLGSLSANRRGHDD